MSQDDKRVEYVKPPEKEYPERDYFQKPRTSERPERNSGPDSDWSGSSWAGERVRGNWGGGRDR